MHAITLINPKTPYNVASVLRACSIFGADTLGWTGTRIPHPDKWPRGTKLPREERMKIYRDVTMLGGMKQENFLKWFTTMGMTPIAVEKRDNAESLDDFRHPQKAVYVFGPEDGSIPRGILAACHRFVRIPTVTEHAPLNLSGAVYVTLYDRLTKFRKPPQEDLEPFLSSEILLREAT